MGVNDTTPKHNHKHKNVVQNSINKVATATTKVATATTNALPFVGTRSPIDLEDKYRWEELQRIETTRRQILTWVEEPFWKTLTHWNGTVLRFLATDGLLWLTMSLYVGIRLLSRLELPGFLASLGKGNISVIGGFLSFFLVFYVNQSHRRFFGLYNDSMKCKGRIFDVATIAITVLPKVQATRLVRYMNAAHAAGYVGLSTTYPSGSFFRRMNDQLGLLTEQELARMKEVDLDQGGSCNRELIAWCMRDIQLAQQDGLLDKELANTLRDHVLKLRAAIGQLYNAKDLPLPFFYVHFICLLTALYLPLFAITAGINAGTGEDVYWVADVVAGLVVFLQAIFVIGLRILGQKMSDPYGDDLVDLSVVHYVTFTWTHSNRILKSYFPDPIVSATEIEHALEQNRKFLGAAWEKRDYQHAPDAVGTVATLNEEEETKSAVSSTKQNSCEVSTTSSSA